MHQFVAARLRSPSRCLQVLGFMWCAACFICAVWTSVTSCALHGFFLFRTREVHDEQTCPNESSDAGENSLNSLKLVQLLFDLEAKIANGLTLF